MSDTTMVIDSLAVVRGGREIVHSISLDVPGGQVAAMLGPNGAGKSTLALAIAGMLRISGGSISVGGTSVSGLRPEAVRAAGVSVVPEGRRLLPDLSVEDNLKVATYSLGKAAAREGLDYSLSLFPELEKRWNIGGRLLSGGEQQMVVLAQALVSKPKVLVVDELSLGPRERCGLRSWSITDRTIRARCPRSCHQGVRARRRQDPLRRHLSRTARSARTPPLRLPAPHLASLVPLRVASDGLGDVRRFQRRNFLCSQLDVEGGDGIVEVALAGDSDDG
jgi:ABC-type branched-subunit amino acid transport system ATPase component